MYPLWDKVIAPTLATARVQRVVEIGALQGETTVKLLDLLGPESELHVIDPVPQFDPAEHERRFPGRYHFHRDISHNVLPRLPAVDAALIDGDHNWYTVHTELEMLAASAREAGAPLPLLFLHDVGWPYGRRDLYYAPERIPEEFRQPYAQKGLQLRGPAAARSGLLERGGFNARMNNAVREGGPRNGVMTALDDFVASHRAGVRVATLPFYFGLAIAADDERIAAAPGLAKRFEELRTPEFLDEMLVLAERLRIKEMQWGQVVFYHWQDRLEDGARRYLDLLRANLRESPQSLDRLEECLATIRADKVDGHLVQAGTEGGGDGSVFMRAFAQAHEMRRANVWVADGEPGSPALDRLRQRLRQFDLLDDRVKLLPGGLAASLPESGIEKVALLRVAADAPAEETLSLLYDRVTLGGYVVVEGLSTPERREEVDRFRAERRVDEELVPVDSGAAVSWRKVG